LGCIIYNSIRKIKKIMANFNPDEVKRLVRELKELQDITDAVNGNLSSWGKSFSHINKVQKEVAKISKQITLLEERKLNASQQDIQNIEQAQQELQNEVDLLEEKIRLVKSERSIQKAIKNELKEKTKEIKKDIIDSTKNYVQQNFSVRAILKDLTSIDDTIRKTNLAIGGTEKGYENIRLSLEGSSKILARIGLSLDEAATFQRIIVESTGRMVTLNKTNVESIGLMIKGTGLAADVIGDLVGGMDMFGKGIESTSVFVEETLNMSNKMGLNGIAVTKKIGENLKKAQGFFFKGGQDKGLRSLVMLSEKFRINIESALSFADKVQTLEGAIETAAQLQVLGGSFANLGNPFQLLFESRNDIVGFTKSLVGANKQIAFFDNESKTFKISALELQRLKSVSEATGISFEDLTGQALELAKLSRAKGQIRFFGSQEEMEMVAKMAKMNEKGGFDITFEKGGKQFTQAISSLTKSDLAYIKTTDKSLRERTEQAMGFDDTLKSITQELKASLLPLLAGVNSTLIKIRELRESFLGKDGEGMAGKMLAWSLEIVGVAPILLSFANVFLSGLGRLAGGGLLNMIGKSAGSAGTAASVAGKGGGIFSSLFGGIGIGGILKGAIAIGIVTASIYGLALAFQEMGKVDWKNIDTGKMIGMVVGIGVVTGLLMALGSLLASGGPITTGMLALGAVIGGGMIALIYGFGVAISKLGNSFKDLSMGVQSIDINTLKTSMDAIRGVLSQSTQSFGSALSQSLFGNKIDGVVKPIVELSKIDSEKLKSISNLFTQAQGKPLNITITDDINIKFSELKVNIEGDRSVINNPKLKENIKEQVTAALNELKFKNTVSVPSINGRG
jgi:hypothetical protein